MTGSPRHLLAVGALCLSVAGVSAFGAQDAPSMTTPDSAGRVIPLAKLQKAVRARDAARRELAALRYQYRQAERLVGLIDHPTPEGNREIARRYFGPEYACAAKIIAGESGWLHDVWNGGERGAWPDRGYRAYGLGQARPRSKMLIAGADAFVNPLTQMKWMTVYADARFGGICAAAAQWSARRSW